MTLRQLLVIFVVALLVRGTWGTLRFVRDGGPAELEFPDEQQYWLMASSLHSGLGLQDELGFRATRMPLYPAALSIVAGATHGVVIAKTAQWIVGALGAVFTAGLAAAFFHRRVAFLAGLLVAFDPFLVFFSSLLLTETLFVAALVGLWWMLAGDVRGEKRALTGWILVGAVAAVTVYTRESSLGLILVTFVLVAIVRRFAWRIMAGVAIAAAVIVASLIPWAARNQALIGEWCWLTTRAGISLYDGVGPTATGVSDLGNIKQMPAVASMTEAEWNRYFLNEALAAIKRDPSRVLRLAGVKLARMWNPIPNVDTYRSRPVRAVSVCWTLPVFAAAAAGLLLLLAAGRGERVRAAAFLLLPAIYMSLLHSVFVGSVRYRLGAMPMLETLAALAIVFIADWVRGRPAVREATLVR